MTTIADYELWKQKQQQAGVGAANVVLGSVEEKPDQVAGDLNLASEFGKTTGNPVPPLPMVKEYRNVFQQKIEEQKNKTILSKAPVLTEWLRNPENAAVARDDLEGLSWWETTFSASGNAVSRGVRRVPQSYEQFMANAATERFQDQSKSFGQILGEEKGERYADPVDLFMAGSRFMTSRLSQVIGGDQKNAAAYYQKQAGEIAKRIGTIPMSPAADTFRKKLGQSTAGAPFMQQLGKFATDVAENPGGALAFLVETAIESTPALATSAAVTAATRSPAAGATFMGATSAAQEMGTSPVDFFREKGVDVSTPEGALAAISNPQLMAEAQERGQTRGLIIGVMDGLSGGLAGTALAASPIGNTLLQAVAQAIMGAGGEAGAQFASGQELNLSDIIVEGLAEFVTAPLEVAGVGGDAFLRNTRKARAADERKAVFEALSGQAQTSLLRNRLPEKFRQLVERATANGPVENIYVPAEQFVTYFQGIDVDPFALVDEMDGVTRDDLEMAIAGGGDLQIPTATYAAKIAGSDHDAFFMENMRFDPDEFTAAEAAEFNAKAQDAMSEAWEVAESVRLEQEEYKAVEAEIYDSMVSRLRTAGRSTDVATNEALLYPAFYRVMAERSGLTTQEFLARYPLPEVAGSLPQGIQTRNVDELNRTLAEARNRKTVKDTRQTLLEFISDYGGINDVGGELKTMGAEVVKRGKGKKSLRLSRSGMVNGMRDMLGAATGGKKHGADDVALAAIEAGFLADDPIANEYRAAMVEGREVPDIGRALWDAIDRELRGEAQYSADQAAPDENAALDSIEEYLNGLGVSLDDTDEAIRQAIEGASAGAQYGQGSATNEIVEAFEAELIADLGLRSLSLFLTRNGDLKLNMIAVDRDKLGSGIGTKAMERIAAFADVHGLRVTLTTGQKDDGFGTTSTARLIKFYKRFGFVENKGRNKDFAISENMYRVPAKSYNQPAYHGTPHLFDKFSLNKIGTGEGAQAFGWGLYFAQKKEIAEHYKAALATRIAVDGKTILSNNRRVGTTGNSEVDDLLIANDGKIDVALNEEREHLDGLVSRGAPERSVSRVRETVAFLQDLKDRGSVQAKTDGRVYTVDIPDDNELIAWDLALKDQPEQILKAIRSVFEPLLIEDETSWDEAINTGQSFGEIYQGMAGNGRSETYIGMGDLDISEKEISEKLAAAGIPGHRFLDGPSRNAVDGTYNYVVYDDSRVEVKSYEQNMGNGPRGSIQFPGDGVGNGDTTIRLFETADLSTLVHESGHYFLTVLQDMARKGEVNAQSEFAALKGWWRENAKAVARDGMNVMKDVALTEADVLAALDAGTTGDVLKDAAIDVGMQEQFARAFEAYLMEGKAPSVELRSAFEKFRAWLISIYQKLAGLNVKPSDEVRNVFDRMLASDAEIAQARQESGDTGPVFATAEAMGLTAEEYASFLKLRAQGEENAKARLLGEIMAPVRREKEKWFKEEREKVRGEVEAEINAYRHYRAIEWMGNRRWLGPDQPEDMPDFRLSKERLTYMYGAGVLKTLPRGKQTVYAAEEGIDPDDAAGWFGFASGDEMVRAMETAVPRKEAIEAETDRVMRERHGDPLNDGSLEADALDAVHNDKRGQWIAAELKAIVDVAETGIGMSSKEARRTARETLSRTRVRDAMNANRFLAAERKAAEEAARLGAQLAREKIWLAAAQRRVAVKARAAVRGDGTVDAVGGAIDALNAKFETTTTQYEVVDRTVTDKAGQTKTIKGGTREATSLGYNDLVARLIETKRRQLLNHALYMEARNITEEVEKAERFVAKLNKKSTRERIAGAGRRENASIDYLGAIDELLDQYDFRKMGPKAEGRRGSLAAFVEAMKAQGRENELAIPESVLARAAMAPYKTLPVEELRGVIDSLKNLEHMALRWNDLIDAQNKRRLDESVAEVVASFDANISKRPPGRVATKGEEWRNRGRQFLDLVLNAGTILREIDGFADLGAAYRNIKAPIDEAMNRLTVRKEKAAVDIEALYNVYSKEDRRRMAVREHMPLLGYALSKWERIAVALNAGNEGNLQRLTDPKVKGSMTLAQVEAVLATLDERDAKFIQSVWDYINTFRDDIAAREKRATGVEPKWVEGSPVVIAGKTLKGGYYPLKYDPRLSSLARDDETQEIAQSLQAGRFGKAQTRNGHLKDRAQSSGRDVELDMSVMHRHVNQVIYDLELSEAVANSWRILQSSGVRSAFTDSGKSADFDALEIWLKDTAEGELKSSDLVGRAARTLKSNFTAAKLALNLGTVALQVTGLSQTMVVVGKKDFVRGLTASFRRGVIAEVTGKSPFMASRQTTFNKDIYDFYADPKEGAAMSRWSEVKRRVIGPASFYLMTKVQFLVVDVPTWMAGYRQGLRRFGNDEAKAVAHADAIVKRAQSSGLFPDRSAIERGSVSRNARQNDVVRLFTALASYMFAKFNVAYERTGKATAVIAREGVSTKSAGEVVSWLVDMGFLFTVEAVLAAAIRGKLPDDEDDDDGWLKFLAKETGLSVMATIPGVRDVSSFTQGFQSGGSYGGIISDLGKGVVSGFNLLAAPFSDDDEVERRDVKAVINGTAIAAGLPGATQLNRIVDAGWREAEGEDVSPFEYILGRR